MIIAVSLLLFVVLLTGCPPQQEWKDLMSGTVRMRSMPTADDITVTFADGGEGFAEALRQALVDKGQVAFRYVNAKGEPAGYPDNPNGAVDDIAGITDETGRILGLMPHPERHFTFTQHPFWTRLGQKGRAGDGARIFENGINYVKKHLLS